MKNLNDQTKKRLTLVVIPFSFNLKQNKECNEGYKKVVEEIRTNNINSNNEMVEIEHKMININSIDEGLKSKAIDKVLNEAGASKKRCVLLGGDHVITALTLKRISKKCKEQQKSLLLVVLDAHADCAASLTEPTNEDWINWLIKNNIIEADNIILFGTRSMDKTEVEFIKQEKIKVLKINSNINDTVYFIMEIARKYDVVYLSIDIDILDALVFPYVNFPEPAGLMAGQLLHIVQKLKLLPQLKFVDITEYNPSKDKDGMGAKLLSKIIIELA